MKLPATAQPNGRTWQVIDADGYILADVLTGSYDLDAEGVAKAIVGALNVVDLCTRGGTRGEASGLQGDADQAGPRWLADQDAKRRQG